MSWNEPQPGLSDAAALRSRVLRRAATIRRRRRVAAGGIAAVLAVVVAVSVAATQPSGSRVVNVQVAGSGSVPAITPPVTNSATSTATLPPPSAPTTAPGTLPPSSVPLTTALPAGLGEGSPSMVTPPATDDLPHFATCDGQLNPANQSQDLVPLTSTTQLDGIWESCGRLAIDIDGYPRGLQLPMGAFDALEIDPSGTWETLGLDTNWQFTTAGTSGVDGTWSAWAQSSADCLGTGPAIAPTTVPDGGTPKQIPQQIAGSTYCGLLFNVTTPSSGASAGAPWSEMMEVGAATAGAPAWLAVTMDVDGYLIQFSYQQVST